MGVNSVIFANTRAYSAQTAMLTAERYQRLSDCADNAELKKCLSEFGYTGDTVDGMLSHAADEIYAYLNDGSPIDAVRRVLLKKNDYHNAKAMVKCKYARREITPELLYPHANIDLSVMKECVLNDEYARLPEPMARALSQIDLRFSKGERSGRVADAVLTRATYEDIFGTLGKNYAELKEVFAAEVDFANLSVALRVRKHGDDISVFDGEFIAGGKIPRQKFNCIFFEKEDKIADEFYGSEYRDILLSALSETEKNAFVDFERIADDYVIALLKKYRGDTSHYMAFYGYVLARFYELKNVRIVCAGVKAGTDREQIKAKLRILYV